MLIRVISELAVAARVLGFSSHLPLEARTHDKADVPAPRRLFIFGLGFAGTAVAELARHDGWEVSGTCAREVSERSRKLSQQGVRVIRFTGGTPLEGEAKKALLEATHILSTIPPTECDGSCPVVGLHGQDILCGHASWVGYLSSTSVYGDRAGGWVDETAEPAPASRKAQARLTAERRWRDLGAVGIPLHTFRLAGLYGPGRSALATLRQKRQRTAALLGSDAAAAADASVAGIADGRTILSRVHVSDVAQLLVRTSMPRPTPGLLLNVADNLPASRREVFAYASGLLKGGGGSAAAAAAAAAAVAASSLGEGEGPRYLSARGGGSKRVDASKMRRLLEEAGMKLLCPDYRVGLQAEAAELWAAAAAAAAAASKG